MEEQQKLTTAEEKLTTMQGQLKTAQLVLGWIEQEIIRMNRNAQECQSDRSMVAEYEHRSKAIKDWMKKKAK